MAVLDENGDEKAAAPEPARAKNLRKKLAQIAELERRLREEEGFVLSEDQEEKIVRRNELEEELEEVLEEFKAALAAAEEAKAPKAAPKADGGGKKRTGTKAKKPAALDVSEPPAMARQWSGTACMSPSMRWQDDPVAVEDVGPSKAPAKEKDTFDETHEFIEGVQPFAAAAQASEDMKKLLKACIQLSRDAFEENCLEMVTRKSRWKLTILRRRPADAAAEGAVEGAFCLEPEPVDPALAGLIDPTFVGFVVYRLRPDHQAFSIAKLAVVPEHRGKGYGCRIMDWCTKIAKKQQNITFISLSSLPEAVRFYRKLGFKPEDVKIVAEEDEELVEGQVYMEYRIKGRGGGKKKK